MSKSHTAAAAATMTGSVETCGGKWFNFLVLPTRVGNGIQNEAGDADQAQQRDKTGNGFSTYLLCLIQCQ